MQRATPGRYLLVDRIGGEVALRRIAARLVAAVIREELAPAAVEQPAAELVAQPVSHNRVHADLSRRPRVRTAFPPLRGFVPAPLRTPARRGFPRKARGPRRAYLRDARSSRPDIPLRAPLPPSFAPSRWRHRGRRGSCRRAAPAR